MPGLELNMATRWTETTRGTYRKPLSHWQAMYAQYAIKGRDIGREHFALRATLQFSVANPRTGPDDVQALLHNAWINLRFLMPALAMDLDPSGDAVTYQVPDAASLEQNYTWLAATFVTIQGATPDQFFRTVLPPRQAQLLYFPDHRTFAIRHPHWVMDMGGLLLVVDAFLSLLGQQCQVGNWGSEVARLHASFDDALALPDAPSDLALAYLERSFAAAVQSPSAGLPVANPAKLPLGCTGLQTLRLAAADTRALVAAAKAAGYSVTTAFHAALALATWDLAPAELQHQQQALVVPHDMRRLVSPPLDGPDFAVNPCVTAQVITVAPGASFDSVASAIHTQYRHDFDPELQLAGAKEATRLMQQWRAQPLPDGVPAAQAPVLSSLGVLDGRIRRTYAAGDAGHLQIDDLRLSGDVTTQQVTLWLYTWDGRLSAVAGYNETYYSAELISSLLARIQSHLGSWLSLTT